MKVIRSKLSAADLATDPTRRTALAESDRRQRDKSRAMQAEDAAEQRERQRRRDARRPATIARATTAMVQPRRGHGSHTRTSRARAVRRSYSRGGDSGDGDSGPEGPPPPARERDRHPLVDRHLAAPSQHQSPPVEGRLP